MVVDRWPIGPNGKLDRAALPSPSSLRPALATGYVAPRDDTERIITRSLAGGPRPRLGSASTTTSSRWAGTPCSPSRSSAASRTGSAANCRSACCCAPRRSPPSASGSPAPRPTPTPRIAPITRTARRQRPAAAASRAATASPAEQGARSGREQALADDEPFELPASFGQERLWLLDRLAAGSAYHLGGAIRLDGPLDPTPWPAPSRGSSNGTRSCAPPWSSAPTASWCSSSIRTSGPPRPGSRRPSPRSTPPAALAEYVDALRPRRAGPLLRTALVRFGETSWLFGVVMHQPSSPTAGRSASSTPNSAAFYRAEIGAEAADLPELPIQYGDSPHGSATP